MSSECCGDIDNSEMETEIKELKDKADGYIKFGKVMGDWYYLEQEKNIKLENENLLFKQENTYLTEKILEITKQDASFKPYLRCTILQSIKQIDSIKHRNIKLTQENEQLYDMINTLLQEKTMLKQYIDKLERFRFTE